MRSIRLLLISLVLAVAGAVCLTNLTGCSTPPSERVAAGSTLKAIGHTAEAAVELSALLYKDGKISGEQAQAVMTFYNQRYLPAFRVAVTAAKFDTDRLAPSEVIALATELVTLVNSYRSMKPTTMHELKPGDKILAPDGHNVMTYLGNGGWTCTLAYVAPKEPLLIDASLLLNPNPKQE
jgi:hypothetical protein